MACYHPNIVQLKENSYIRKDGEIGHKAEKIIFANDPAFKGYEYYLSLNENPNLKYNDENHQRYIYKMIPCGKCIGCRATERKNWAIRIELESKKYKNNYFITLTYNDEHLKIKDFDYVTVENKEYPNTFTSYIYENNGSWNGTLEKKDMSNFLKQFRKYCKREFDWDGIKFYGCGEYGEKTQRNHFHIILMNCPKLDLEPIGQNQHTKRPRYTNKRIEKLWGKGFIEIGEVTWESISYVAGYTTKKMFGTIGKQYFAQRGQNPIFANMSRRPGIGREFFDNNLSMYDFDEIINSKGQAIQPPKYFDRLLDKDNHEYLEAIKRIRENKQKINLENKLKQTGLSLKEQLKIEEKTAAEKQRHYSRGRINESISAR